MINRRKALAGVALVPLLAAGLPSARAGEAGELTADSRGLLPDDRTMGDKAAPAVLIEYASLSCPHCARFHTQMLPGLKEEWIDQGKLLYVYRDFPLNAPALWAALLSLCLEGDAYFAFLDILYKEQMTWLTAEDPGAALFQIGQLAGFDQERFAACLENEETFERVIMGIEHGESTYGVDATPTLILNGERISPGSYDELSRLIAEQQES